jgi:CRP-like cAMP-binding protein
MNLAPFLCQPVAQTGSGHNILSASNWENSGTIDRVFRRSEYPAHRWESQSNFTQGRAVSQYAGEQYDKLFLFDEIPYAEVKEILEKSRVVLFEPESVILRPGQQNTDLFQILEGELRIDFADSVSQEIVQIGVGSCFGELSIVD